LVFKIASEEVRTRAEATRILRNRNRVIEREVADLHRSCERQVSDCLADKAMLLISEQRMSGLICPEIEQRIIHGVDNRHPYDLLIEGALIRRYFSKGRNLNTGNIPTDQALKAWVVLYDIAFEYDSSCDTYHFSKLRIEGF